MSIPATFDLPPGYVKDTHVSNVSTDRLAYTKAQSLFQPECNFCQAIGSAPATREEIKYVGKVGGTILGFKAQIHVVAGTPTITFDLKKNDVSILSAVLTFNIGSGGAVQSATLSSNTFSAGDVFSYSMTVTSGGSCSGAVAWASFIETTQPTS